MMEGNVLAAVQDSLGPEPGDPDTPRLVCDFIQARDPEWVKRPFFAEFDEDAAWFDELKPAFGKSRFYFEAEGDREASHALPELTELLLE